eukprot:3123071-Ditylum_brightwellii.AAC.1
MESPIMDAVIDNKINKKLNARFQTEKQTEARKRINPHGGQCQHQQYPPRSALKHSTPHFH